MSDLHPQGKLIQLNKNNNVELPNKQTIRYIPANRYSYFPNLITGSPSARFISLVDGCGPVSNKKANSIFMFDMFVGSGRKLQPKDPSKVSKIFVCTHLSETQAFLIYSTPVHFKRISLISIDTQNNYYEFVGESQYLSGNSWSCFVSFHEEPFILVHSIQQFYIYDLDPVTFKITAQREFMINKNWVNACFFNKINGELIFATLLDFHAGFGIKNLRILGQNNQLRELENTAFRLGSLYATSNRRVFMNGLQGGWYGDKLFICINAAYFHQLRANHFRPLGARSAFLMFEFKTKRWTEIRVPLPDDRIYYQFHIDFNGTLNFITYKEEGINPDGTLELRPGLIRIPLKEPEKLLNLSWFKVRASGLDKLYQNLKNFI